MSTSSPSPSTVNLNEDEGEDTPTLIGSGEYQIVGIRYYSGVAHPGEYVNLVREPRNPYDRNAIRVDNLRGEKIGHIKATMAKFLSPVMDKSDRLQAKIYGAIPRKGNAYTLPLLVEFYFTGRPEMSQQTAAVLQKAFKRDYSFQLSRAFGGDGVSASSVLASQTPKSKVTTKKLDWNQQQKALDEMFDKTLSEQYKDLPDVSMPTSCLKGITLFEHQVQGIKWMIKKEKFGGAAPFYKKVKEQGRPMHLCEITNSSQAEPPKPIRGSILCDDMGLGKTMQVIGLILLAPPPGVEYKVQTKIGSEQEVLEKEYIPLPEESVIRAANASTLKSVVKAAKLKVSGKKADLLQRIFDGKVTQAVTGEHFPLSMRPRIDATSSSSTRCTLIVCPVSVMSNWVHQVRSHVEDGVLSLQMYHGTNRQGLLPAVQAGNVDILLVSYHTLAAEYGVVLGGDGDGEGPRKKKSKRETIFDIDFHRIVLDEAVSSFYICDVMDLLWSTELLCLE
jgi:SWI/SNF-related matrix-associated actin-dependent regulator of chromatin subfamily A3